jgi:hypothetical protein
VDNARLVRRSQRRGHLGGDVQHLRQRQPVIPRQTRQPLAQGLALQVLHDDVGRAVRKLAALGDLDDAGMSDAVGGAGLVLEATRRVPIGGKVGAQHLDRHAALDPLVERLVDYPHTALAELAHDTVGTDCRMLCDHSCQYHYRRSSPVHARGPRSTWVALLAGMAITNMEGGTIPSVATAEALKVDPRRLAFRHDSVLTSRAAK